MSCQSNSNYSLLVDYTPLMWFYLEIVGMIRIWESKLSNDVWHDYTHTLLAYYLLSWVCKVWQTSWMLTCNRLKMEKLQQGKINRKNLCAKIVWLQQTELCVFGLSVFGVWHYVYKWHPYVVSCLLVRPPHDINIYLFPANEKHDMTVFPKWGAASVV